MLVIQGSERLITMGRTKFGFTRAPSVQVRRGVIERGLSGAPPHPNDID